MLKKGLNSFVDFVSLVSAFPFLVFFLFLLLFLSHFLCFLSSACFLFHLLPVPLHFQTPPPLPFCLSPSPPPPLPCLVLFEVEPSGGTPRRRPLSFCPCCVQEGNVTPRPHPTAPRAIATLVTQGPTTQLFLSLTLDSPVTKLHEYVAVSYKVQYPFDCLRGGRVQSEARGLSRPQRSMPQYSPPFVVGLSVSNPTARVARVTGEAHPSCVAMICTGESRNTVLTKTGLHKAPNFFSKQPLKANFSTLCLAECVCDFF